MRITGGVWGGRHLQLPKGPRIRPTQDQVRQALFNLLGEAVRGARVLDLFCGSGALGLEALSRRASHATFVDRSPFCIDAVRVNLDRLDIAAAGHRACRLGTLSAVRPRSAAGAVAEASPQAPPVASAGILQSDAVSAIRKLDRLGQRFDLVFLDPPYAGGLARKALITLSRYVIVSAAGWVIVEHDKRDPLPEEWVAEGSRLVSQRIEQYGDTALALYRRQ